MWIIKRVEHKVNDIFSLFFLLLRLTKPQYSPSLFLNPPQNHIQHNHHKSPWPPSRIPTPSPHNHNLGTTIATTHITVPSQACNCHHQCVTTTGVLPSFPKLPTYNLHSHNPPNFCDPHTNQTPLHQHTKASRPPCPKKKDRCFPNPRNMITNW